MGTRLTGIWTQFTASARRRRVFTKFNIWSFAEVGDSKVTWELNRHQHLVTLAKASGLTGDRRYADEILQHWRQWRAENPYPVGINWASSLEVSFRSLSWLWTYHLLQGSPEIADFREEWLRSLALHGRHIERYLSTYFSPNTHLLGEGVGLFFLGVLCPELAAAERWKALGWEIVLREAERQVQADGFHFEQSTYYHVYALDFFLHSAILADAEQYSRSLQSGKHTGKDVDCSVFARPRRTSAQVWGRRWREALRSPAQSQRTSAGSAGDGSNSFRSRRLQVRRVRSAGGNHLASGS